MLKDQSKAAFVYALGFIDWHELEPDTILNILDQRQFNRDLKLLLSTSLCPSDHGHFVKVDRVVNISEKHYLVLQIPPDPTFEDDLRVFRKALVRVADNEKLVLISSDEAEQINSVCDDLNETQENVVESAVELLGEIPNWDEDALKRSCRSVSTSLKDSNV